MKDMPAPLQEASLSDKERASIAAYNIAAADIYRQWWPYRQHEFRANLFNQVEGDSASLIPRGDFTAMSVAVRLLLLDKEPANFERVVDTLSPIAGAPYGEALQQVRNAWRDVFSGAPVFVFSTRNANYDTKRAIELWLYGSSLHRHAEHRPDVEALKSFDPIVSMLVQHGIWRLATNAIALWSIIEVMDGREPIVVQGEEGPDLPDTLFAGAP